MEQAKISFEAQVQLLDEYYGMELIRIAHIVQTDTFPVLKWELHKNGAELLVLAVKVLISFAMKSPLRTVEGMVNHTEGNVQKFMGNLSTPTREIIKKLLRSFIETGSYIACLPGVDRFLSENFEEEMDGDERLFSIEIQQFIEKNIYFVLIIFATNKVF